MIRILLALPFLLFSIFIGGCDRRSEDAGQGGPSLAAFAGVETTPASAASGEKQSAVPRYELTIKPEFLRAMERDYLSDKTYPAQLMVSGQTHQVTVRFRGAWARHWPKKSFKIFFEKGKEWEGQESLNLNSGWRDPAFIREPLAYHIYQVCGVPAPRSRVVQLMMNGRFAGLYIDTEQPDKPLLARHNLKGGAVYKANSRGNQADERDLGDAKNYAQHYEKQTAKSENYDDLASFCRDLARATNAAEFFDRRVEVDKFINYLAATALVQNWDSYNKNHYLVRDRRGSGKWMVVPWDLDRTLGDHWSGPFSEANLPLLSGTEKFPGPTGWNRLTDKFLKDASLRKRFFQRLQQLLQTEFTTEKIFPVIDRMEKEISALVEQDRKLWGGNNPSLRPGIEELKSVVERRRKFLLQELARAK